ncbi:hypothetical protein [Bacillus sp. GeD10]|uniref:hypothetical protein n=1 Tax=Bacillus sp. GeD10 TaxID=1301086 RepID=UPI0002D23351|nr:hypothetical protein [Bacillus sp. GeD10]CCW04103.1 hypothetical protein EBGED10_8190 [Bacillus sp. GeD10]
MKSHAPEANKKDSSTVEKVTIEESDDWYVREIKKTVYTSVFSLLVSIAVLIFTFYRS